MSAPTYAAVSTPVNGTVKVAVGEFPPVTVPWRGSTVAALNEALDLLECEPHVVGESRG